MAVENYTTYTEVDSGGDITVNAADIAVSTMQRVANSSVYKDKGVNHFGNFEHLLDEANFGVNPGLFAVGGIWHISNTASATLQDLIDADDGYMVYFVNNSGTFQIEFTRKDGTDDSDTFNSQVAFDYWITIERTAATMTCKIYTDASRTTLTDTLSITRAATSYRYIGTIASRDAAGTVDLSYTIGQLDLQEQEAILAPVIEIKSEVQLPAISTQKQSTIIAPVIDAELTLPDPSISTGVTINAAVVEAEMIINAPSIQTPLAAISRIRFDSLIDKTLIGKSRIDKTLLDISKISKVEVLNG